MRCPICDNEKEWENVTELRDDEDKTYKDKETGEVKPHNMEICLKCGFVGYPDRQSDEQKLKEYYRENYRAQKPPGFNNLVTGQRKVYYHEQFLKPLFKEWHSKGKVAPVITEIGAAFGMALNFFRNVFPKATILGTEWTLKYRRVCFYEYGITLDEDFDPSRKYDLIMSYKVLEHQVDPDKKLREYAECLTADGRVYLSVPTWFNNFSNFGLSGADLKYYYHPDHINVWSRHLLEQLLNKCGLEIDKQDHHMYGDTYLLKRNDELMKKPLDPEDPQSIKKAMANIKKSFNFYKKQKFEEAISHWANFPGAWTAFYEQNRKELHKKYEGNFNGLYDAICKPFMEHNKRGKESLSFAADLCMRYEQWELGATLLNELLEKVPNNSAALMMLGHCLRNMALHENDVERRVQMLNNAYDVTNHLSKVDLQAMSESVNWKYRDASELVAPFELTEQQGENNGNTTN